MQVTSGPRDGAMETVGLPGGQRFRLYSNRPMSGASDVVRALVVIHGAGRNAEGYFERALAAAKEAGVDRDTLVVSPWFEGWSSDAWKEGGGELSSLAVMDQLVASLSDAGRWPNLRRVVLVGHSAGGQFTQRYAAFGDAPAQPWADPMTFVVMNPSSYAWLTWTRPGRTCDGFDDYKYGLKARSGYVGRLSDDEVRARFAGRRVLIALGGGDDTQNGNMDVSCAALAQGPHRLARGQAFVAATKAALPSAAVTVIIVPGVDHDSTRMLSSPLLRPTLFGVAEGDG